MRIRELSRAINTTKDNRLYTVVAVRERGVATLNWENLSDEESDVIDEVVKISMQSIQRAADAAVSVGIVPKSEYDFFEKKGGKDRFAYFVYAPSFLSQKEALAMIPKEDDEQMQRTWRVFSEIAENEEEEAALDEEV